MPEDKPNAWIWTGLIIVGGVLLLALVSALFVTAVHLI